MFEGWKLAGFGFNYYVLRAELVFVNGILDIKHLIGYFLLN
jgi:hypothetical protein